jgi:hypothetical protein
VQTHGDDSLAFFSLRRDKNYFFSPTRDSFLAYKVVAGVALVSGGPIGAREEFAISSPSSGVSATHVAGAWHCSGCTRLGACRLCARLRAIKLGDEAVVRPAQFSLGRTLGGGRCASPSRVSSAPASPSMSSRRGSRAAAARRARARLRRLARRERRARLLDGDGRSVPRAETLFAVASNGGRVGGFLHLVPSAHGYSLGAMRRDPATPNGLMEFLIVETLGWARAEGADELSLNFCVFADILAGPDGRRQRAARGVLLAGDRLFQLERLLRFSRKFRPSGGRVMSASSASPTSRSSRSPTSGWNPCSRRPVRGPGGRPCNTEPMAQPASRNLGRLSEIAQVAVRHGFGYWFDTHRLTDLFPRRGPRLELDGQPSQRGQHLREMLDELGPTFVKFGQLLSTRPDVLPPDIIAELRGLQDDVRPVPLADIEKVVEEDLGLTVAQLFSEFEERPVAAASIGQVHRATLPNGKRVAVKVQRPGAPRQIEADLALLYQAARIAKERVRALDFIDARQLVDEFARQIRQELDYRLEARNADTFHRNFAGHPHVRVPRVYWSYTRSRVLTLEWLEGTQVADIHPDEWRSRTAATSRT